VGDDKRSSAGKALTSKHAVEQGDGSSTVAFKFEMSLKGERSLKQYYFKSEFLSKFKKEQSTINQLVDAFGLCKVFGCSDSRYKEVLSVVKSKILKRMPLDHYNMYRTTESLVCLLT